MDEGTPGQDFHSQATPPALHLPAFTAQPATQLQPFCTSQPPSKLGIELILLSRGRAHQCAPSSRGWWAEGGRRPALARALLWHILIWSLTAKQPPKASVRNHTEGIFQWTQEIQFRRFSRKVYTQEHVSLRVCETQLHCQEAIAHILRCN